MQSLSTGGCGIGLSTTHSCAPKCPGRRRQGCLQLRRRAGEALTGRPSLKRAAGMATSRARALRSGSTSSTPVRITARGSTVTKDRTRETAPPARSRGSRLLPTTRSTSTESDGRRAVAAPRRACAVGRLTSRLRRAAARPRPSSPPGGEARPHGRVVIDDASRASARLRAGDRHQPSGGSLCAQGGDDHRVDGRSAGPRLVSGECCCATRNPLTGEPLPDASGPGQLSGATGERSVRRAGSAGRRWGCPRRGQRRCRPRSAPVLRQRRWRPGPPAPARPRHARRPVRGRQDGV